MAESVAVEVRDGVKSYVEGTLVLNHMNMTVPRGTIYGLLGSSGCGKTSILSCIVGLRQLDSGKILVFGREPGSEGSGIPGSRLGYMPQDTALYPLLSIRETLSYFGRIYGMSKDDIAKRSDFLTTFLKLPDGSNQICTLSGGQQRRTSLAAAFVHDPQLLILDEPTVGLDPLLRISIWDHLCEMTKNGRTTVIVTTHYVEEARRSDTIGLMRNGRLLVENSPDNLLNMFDAPYLEDIVLKLCRQDHDRIKSGRGAIEMESSETNANSNSLNSPYPRSIAKVPTTRFRNLRNFLTKIPFLSGDKNAESSKKYDCTLTSFSIRNGHYSEGTSQHKQVLNPSDVHVVTSSRTARVHSLLARNGAYFFRHIHFMIMALIFPALQTTLVAVTIGADPKNMSLAIVNEELTNWKNSCDFTIEPCKMDKFSCAFLHQAEKNDINLVSFPTREKALEETHSGKLYGLLTIPQNYTENVKDRAVFGLHSDNETLDGSILRVNLDYSNYVASLLLTRQIFDSLISYGMELGDSCANASKEYEIPLKYKKPVYGTLESTYTEYVVPGALVMIVFIIPLSWCGIAFVTDKRLGTLDRSTVAGVTAFDMMISMCVTDGIMIFFQALLSTLILVLGFDFKVQGSYILYGILCLLTGLCGQAYGFVLGLLCPDEGSLLITAFTLHFPMLILGGIIWPLDGIYRFVRYFSHCLPVTASLHSMRSIISRGVGITNNGVWPGFLILIAWIVAAWAVGIMKYRTMRR